jgi:signal transduction histidine kinase
VTDDGSGSAGDSESLRKKLELLEGEIAALKNAAEISNGIFSIASHELRAPMQTILGWSKLLRSRGLDHADAQRGLDAVERSAKTQAQVLEELVDIAHVISGRSSVEIAPIDAFHCVETALAGVGHVAEEKRVKIVASLQPGVGLISGDARRMQMIVRSVVRASIARARVDSDVVVKLEKREEHVVLEIVHQPAGPAESVSDTRRAALELAIAKRLIADQLGLLAVAEDTTEVKLPVAEMNAAMLDAALATA